MSVVIADYIQFVVLSFGMLLTTYLAINNLGWDNIFSTVARIKGEAGFNPTIKGSGFVGITYWQYFNHIHGDRGRTYCECRLVSCVFEEKRACA